jgi:hypothetical protein
MRPTDHFAKMRSSTTAKTKFLFFEQVLHIYVHFCSTAIINGKPYFQAPRYHPSTIKSHQCDEYRLLINSSGSVVFEALCYKAEGRGFES